MIFWVCKVKIYKRIILTFVYKYVSTHVLTSITKISLGGPSLGLQVITLTFLSDILHVRHFMVNSYFSLFYRYVPCCVFLVFRNTISSVF